MADIAAKVGISSVAVGMALRDHHRVSVERRREVKRVARELGFVPDPFLSALAAHRRQRVSAKDHGVLAWINHWQDPKQLRQFREFDLYWEGANAAAARFGYRLDEIRWAPDCPPILDTGADPGGNGRHADEAGSAGGRGCGDQGVSQSRLGRATSPPATLRQGRSEIHLSKECGMSPGVMARESE